MAGMSFTEKIGFIRMVVEFMGNNAEILKAAGYNTDMKLKDLEADSAALTAANNLQEVLKARLHEQTDIVNNLTRKTYTSASGALDAMMGVIGKDTPLAKTLHRFRSDVRQRPSAPRPETAASKN